MVNLSDDGSVVVRGAPRMQSGMSTPPHQPLVDHSESSSRARGGASEQRVRCSDVPLGHWRLLNDDAVMVARP